MTIDFSQINWLAVAAAAGGTFLLGGLWYTALFGKKWAAFNGYSDEKLKQMHAKTPPPVFFGVLLVCYFIMALVLALLVTGFNVTGATNGAVLGALVWVVVAAVGMTGHIANDRHIGVYAIDTSYQLIYLIGTGVILASWR